MTVPVMDARLLPAADSAVAALTNFVDVRGGRHGLDRGRGLDCRPLRQRHYFSFGSPTLTRSGGLATVVSLVLWAEWHVDSGPDPIAWLHGGSIPALLGFAIVVGVVLLAHHSDTKAARWSGLEPNIARLRRARGLRGPASKNR
jgi:hypothetical protein